MFVKKTGGSYWWPGVIRTPSETVEGEFDEAPIKLKIKRIGFKESQAYSDDKELLKNVILDWSGIEDKFSPDTMAEYVDDQFIGAAFGRIYFDALQKARTGN
jgi:hypothetical protein